MGSREIHQQVRAIREQYDTHFDQTWFRILLDECPLDRGVIPEIRSFLDSEPAELESQDKILYGISGLEQFVRTIETYLLPHIKELLGVSALRPDYRLQDREQYIHRRLLAEVLPYNVAVLKDMIRLLKQLSGTQTPPVLPDLPVYRSA